jgi:uncharacterized protein YlaN (UPF0358 family)
MASTLTDWPGSLLERGPGFWERFLDGQVWRLQRGVDFAGEVANARSGLYMARRRRYGTSGESDYIVRTIVVDRTIGKEVLLVQLQKRPHDDVALGPQTNTD